MSLNNLLEVDNLNDHNRTSSAWKPKAKPRVEKSSSRRSSPSPHKENPQPPPRPKPRRVRRRERDVDQVLSMSSISSVSGGDHHMSQSAYDNPLFLSDDGELGDTPRKSVRNGTPPTKERESGGHDSRKVRNSRRHERRYSEDSSAWEGEESYLYIENEVKSPANKRRSRRDSLNGSVNDIKQIRSSANTPQKRKPEDATTKGHVTIQLEEDKEEEQVKIKPKIGSIWKRFLSRSTSNSGQQKEQQEMAENLEEKGKEDTPKKVKKTRRKKVLSGTEDGESSSENNEKITTRSPKTKKQEKSPILRNKLKQREKITLVEKTSSIKEKAKKKLQSLKSSEERNKSHKKVELVAESQDEDTDQGSPVQQKKTLSPRHKSKLEMDVKSPKKYRKKKTPPEQGEQLLLGITVHGSDLLPMDPNLLHPVVKVTLMTQDGQMITKRESFWSGPSSSPPPVTSKRRKSRKHEDHTNTILPIMTQPFNFHLDLANPTWNELLLFEEPFHQFLQENPDLIIFFEIMDFLPMDKANTLSDGIHGSDVGWYKLAWAFLKPLGANGVLNTDKKVRLQLFKPMKLRKREVLEGPEVFSWWKSGRREKLFNTTLYVTVKGVCPPLPKNTSIKKLLSMRKHELTDVVVENQLEMDGWKSIRSNKKKREEIDVRKTANWARLEGQTCKVPNKFLTALPSSPIESLNLTISGNVHCLKFSPCGLKLAAGLDTDDLHAILIFDIPSGTLMRSLKNHHGLIYDLCWTELELSETSYVQYLASASADSTACVWSMKNNNQSTLTLLKTLHHPSFVYAVKFHPIHPALVVTACFDFIIRVWSIERGEGSSRKSPPHQSSPLFILDQHCSFVNCLVFDASGSHLFSADGDSWVYKWAIQTPTKRRTWVVERETKLTETGKVAVNSLSIHPSGIRLLCHLRDNCLKILDTVSFTPLHTIRGLVNDRLQIKSCFSPCGNLILSGSEDSTICIWDADTYAIADFITPKNHSNCVVTSVDYHPHDFYVAVGLASVISEPNPILLYTYDSPKFSRTAMVQAGVVKFKSNLRNAQSRSEEQRNKSVTFSGRRGDSSEKFTSIIDKLDAAFKDSGRVRRRSETLQRSVSVSVDIEARKTSPRRSSRSTSVDTSLGDSAHKSTSHHDMDTPTHNNNNNPKSPRTFIENRLEELILPVPIKNYKSETLVAMTQEHTSSTETELQSEVTATLPPMAPKSVIKPPPPVPRLPKRPHSSKIPVRQSKNGSPTHNLSHSVPSSPNKSLTHSAG